MNTFNVILCDECGDEFTLSVPVPSYAVDYSYYDKCTAIENMVREEYPESGIVDIFARRF